MGFQGYIILNKAKIIKTTQPIYANT